MTTLVVLPGLSSPAHPKYLGVYSLLRESAPRYGYETVRVITYPGQMLARGNTVGRLSPEAATRAALRVLHGLEKKQVAYRLMGMSFGCSVALASVKIIQEQLTHLEKIVLWGPIPYWLSWRSFVADAEIDKRLGLGTVFIKNSKTFHHQTRPIEVLLPEITRPVHVCVGTKDNWVHAEYIQYLSAISKDNKNIILSIVEGCSHNVEKTEGQNWQAYLDAVFS